MKKRFSTAAVASVTSGISLVNNFSDIHEVLDFFYSGCMTHSIPALMEPATKHIVTQHPLFEGAITKEHWQQDLDSLVALVGETVELETV